MASDKELQELTHSKYWDERYASEMEAAEDGNATLGSYEWFRKFNNLRSFFATYLPVSFTDCYILHMGCGSSVNHFLAPIPIM
jgi:hypothetical protein